VALAAGLVAIVGFIATLALGGFERLRGDSQSAGTTTSCERMFRITHPSDLTEISGKAGVEIRGTACEDDDVWLLDRDPFDGLLYQTNRQALDVVNGAWAFRDQPVGNAENDDLGTVYTIVAIRANRACNAAFQEAPTVQGRSPAFRVLPESCPDLNDGERVRKVRVKKLRP